MYGERNQPRPRESGKRGLDILVLAAVVIITVQLFVTAVRFDQLSKATGVGNTSMGFLLFGGAALVICVAYVMFYSRLRLCRVVLVVSAALCAMINANVEVSQTVGSVTRSSQTSTGVWIGYLAAAMILVGVVFSRTRRRRSRSRDHAVRTAV